MKYAIWFGCIVLLQFNVLGQGNLTFHVRFGEQPIQLGDTIFAPNNSSKLVITQLKWYISSICFLENDSLVYAEPNSFHLVDLSDSTSLNLTFPYSTTTTFNSLIFKLGIDSLTNVSGAMGDDLDPMLGMYWTWQSGYINFKLEGVAEKINLPSKTFQYHLGGYQYPVNSLRTVQLPIIADSKQHIVLDLQPFFDQTDVQNTHHIMSPTPEALLIADKLVTCFKSVR